MTQPGIDTTIWHRARAHVLGRSRQELTTPALVLDLDRARGNIERMAAHTRALSVGLRPHVKVHKSARLAQAQIQAGAIGVTTATVWEAMAMARAGIDDILIANEVVGGAPMRALAELAVTARVLVIVDDAENAEQLGAAARAAGVRIGALVDVDTGMGRCGVRSATAARDLALRIAAVDGLDFLGASGYEGHCMLEPDPARRARAAQAAMDVLLEAVDAIAAAGLQPEIVSAGGTGTYHLTGANPRITELQAGSYCVMDAFHSQLVAGGFEVALTVMSTVLSRHGTRVILDAGCKAIGIDEMLPQIAGIDAEPVFVHEEHAGFDVPADAPLRAGDVVELLPGYAPTTANLHDAYHVVEDGVVTDLWPVEARYGTATLG